ncbi:MAG: HEAT repeat domain-containing protein [Planctomycetaceae bacterium]|nr:HEAT repeat domain-containing protein [Planctomycetaceae bacterium]
MTTIAQLRTKARKLIQTGTKELSSQTAVKKPATIRVVNRGTGEVKKEQVLLQLTSTDQYLTVYEEARDLLLEHGYELQLAPKAQALYQQLIAENDEFLALQKKCLKPLSSPKPSVRLKAAREVEKITREEVTRYRALSLRHPETVTDLLNALNREEDPQVQSEIVASLGAIYGRYFADLRIFPAVLSKLDSSDRKVQERAAMALTMFTDREKWPPLLKLFSNRPGAPLLSAICRNIRDDVPVSWKRKLQPALLTVVESGLPASSKQIVFDAMLRTLDHRTISNFSELLAGKKQLLRSLVSHTRKTRALDRDGREFVISELSRLS